MAPLNGAPTSALTVGFIMPPQALSSPTHAATAPLFIHSHRSMSVCRGASVRQTKDDYARRRRCDDLSAVCAERHNLTRRNQILKQQALRARASPPTHPPPPSPSYVTNGCRMMAEEAQNHPRNNIPVPADRCLPAGWVCPTSSTSQRRCRRRGLTTFKWCGRPCHRRSGACRSTSCCRLLGRCGGGRVQHALAQLLPHHRRL